MKQMKLTRFLAVAALAMFACAPGIQAQGGQTTGPDVIVGAIPNISNYSALGGIDAISVGTTSCNIGDQILLWQANTPNHPVIAQHLYRLWNGRLDMIGQSWLKHGFATVNNNICGTCTGPTGQQLYPGCSDPYGSSLNGSQSGLGPKFEINAYTGVFPMPFTGDGTTGNSIFKRLQFQVADVSTVTYPGARFFVESQYVMPDDAAAGNGLNNSSYREVFLSGSSEISGSFSSGSPTVQERAVIDDWAVLDTDAAVQVVDIPNEGRLTVGYRATTLGSGLTQHVFAVHNLNSHRSVQSVSVDMPAGATVTNVQFQSPSWHSGETYSNTPWPGAYNGSSVSWATDTEAVDPNANAIRWGTTYTFSFESDLAPLGSVDLGLFRAGLPNVVQASFVPPTPPAFVISAPNGVPETVLALQTTDVALNVANVAGAADPASAQLFVSIDGAGFQASPLTHNGGSSFTATLPAASCDATIDWYVSIDAVGGASTETLPNLAPANFNRATAVTDIILFSDDFETDTGWTVANTNLTDGAWERTTPNSGGTRGDPLTDSDGSGQAFITDDDPNTTNSDVDGGPTILTSPALDLTGYSQVLIGFDLWFVNDGNTAVDDTMEIEINDNVGSGWVLVEQLTASTQGWETRTINVGDLVEMSNSVQVRFVVGDTPNNSIVEAGVDAFAAFACPLLIEEFAQGNVGANSGSPEQVLLVNGSTGGVLRHVVAPLGSPLSFAVAQPSTHPVPANFAIFGRLGVPNPNEVYDIGLGVGFSNFFPCPADASNPALFVLFNNLLGTNCAPLLPATTAPFSIGFGAGINFPIVFTLQGVISDDDATLGGAAPFSVTNAVVYETR
jgi:hypothetical protein